MSEGENINQELQPQEGAEPQTQTPDVPDSGGLPSALDEGKVDVSKWGLNDEFQDANFKNGKLLDRFDSLEDLVAGYKEMSAKHANYVRDIKNGEKATEQEAIQAQQQQEEVQAKEATTTELATELLNNNMSLTPEIKAKIEESGLSIESIENKAFKTEKMVAKAYESVGGKEEYEAMATWAKENLSDDVRLDFDRNLSSPSADIYIKGLHAQYKANGGETQTPQPTERISGETATVGVVRGYATQAEMLRDVNYINGAGSNDTGAIKAHQARMSKTSDEVIYG